MATIKRSASCPEYLNKVKIRRHFKRPSNANAKTNGMEIIDKKVLYAIFDDEDKFKDFYIFMEGKGKENYLEFIGEVVNFEALEGSKRVTIDPHNTAFKIWSRYICDAGKKKIDIRRKTRTTVTNSLSIGMVCGKRIRIRNFSYKINTSIFWCTP